jgi:hypothetical protein
VTGVRAQSFLDKRTGFRDPGYGLDIVDWIMEPGSDLAYRDRLDKELVYHFNDEVHGKTAKRSIEGPQICTQAFLRIDMPGHIKHDGGDAFSEVYLRHSSLGSSTRSRKCIPCTTSTRERSVSRSTNGAGGL